MFFTYFCFRRIHEYFTFTEAVNFVERGNRVEPGKRKVVGALKQIPPSIILRKDTIFTKAIFQDVFRTRWSSFITQSQLRITPVKGHDFYSEGPVMIGLWISVKVEALQTDTKKSYKSKAVV